MAELPDERQLVLGARSQLDRWTKSARREAYVELFDGDDPFSPRRDATARCARLGTGATGRRWCLGTDQYGIHTTGTSSSNTSLGVVCVYHPQITTDSVLRGGTTSTTRPKSGSTPRSGNTASTSRHSSKHNSTSSFIKTSGTPDQIAFSDRTNLSIVAVSSVTGVTCLEVLFSYSSGVSTLNISGTL